MSGNYESGYDPYTPSGHGVGGSSSQGNNKTAHIQAQIDETVGVMRDNIQKVNERGENLSDLQGKTGEFILAWQIDNKKKSNKVLITVIVTVSLPRTPQTTSPCQLKDSEGVQTTFERRCGGRI